MKNTRQRRAILEALCQSAAPVTAEEIATLVANQVPGIALSTVYRNLERLAETGVIVRVTLENGVSHYEPASAPHGHYLICKKCQKRIKLKHCPLEAISCQLEAETGFHIQGHDLRLYGICPECQTKGLSR